MGVATYTNVARGRATEPDVQALGPQPLEAACDPRTAQGSPPAAQAPAGSASTRHEGAWNDPNAPYYGGLQMDLSFQRTYGPRLLRRKGTADHWTPVEQMWVAERAHRSGRGYYPWPNTARYCGLI